MTAGPGQYDTGRPPGWFVVTDQGVALRGPLPDRPAAEAARVEVLDDMRAGLERARRPAAFIAERIAAVRVAHGVRTWPHGRFEPGTEAEAAREMAEPPGS
jgi:hypothetical protein